MHPYEQEQKEILVPSGKTTMVDIHEAAGGTANEDRTQVSITPPLKAFEIVLKVVPTGFEYGPDGERVTFAIFLMDEVALQPGPGGVQMRHVRYEEEVTLPVSQVKILKR